MGLPAGPALGGGLPGPIGARAPSPRRNREHTSPGPPSRSPAWWAPTGSTRPCASSWGVSTSRCRVVVGSALRAALGCATPCGRGFPSRVPRTASSSSCCGPVGRTGGSGPSRDPGSPAGNVRLRAAVRRHCTLVPWVDTLGPEAGRPVRLGGTGVQHDDVAGEACSRGSRPGARRVLSKGVHLPPRQGPSSEGIRYGLGGSLVCRGLRAPLRPQVAEPDVVKAASHTKPPAVVLRGIVADDLVAAVPLPPPPGLDCSIPFEPWATGLGRAQPGQPDQSTAGS